MVNKALFKFLNIFCVVYLDDILIFLETLDKYYNYVAKVLQALLKLNLRVKLEKYEFNKNKIKFLGFKFSNSKVIIDLVKTIPITT